MTPILVTPPGADRDAWLAARQQGIGASEIAAVMGISPWDSPFSLYWKKANGWSSEVNEEMRTGTHLEDAIADWWAAENDPHENLAVAPTGLWQHPDRPWQLATPDRLIYMTCAACSSYGQGSWDPDACDDCAGTGIGSLTYAVLECKWTPSWDGWGDAGTDDIPVYYRCQVLWQCDVMGVDEWHLSVLGPTGFRAYQGRRDERDLEVMREHGARFWARLEAGDPPDVDGHTATLTTLKRLHPDVEDREQQITAEVAAGYRRARALRDQADRLARSFEAKLRAQLGNGRTAVDPDGRRLATRSVFPVRRIDTTALRADEPELAEKYTTTTTTDRLTPSRSKR